MWVDSLGLDRYVTQSGIHKGLAVDLWKDGKKTGVAYFDFGPKSYVNPSTGECSYGKWFGNLLMGIIARAGEVAEHSRPWSGQDISETIGSTEEQDSAFLNNLRNQILHPEGSVFSHIGYNCRYWVNDNKTNGIPGKTFMDSFWEGWADTGGGF